MNASPPNRRDALLATMTMRMSWLFAVDRSASGAAAAVERAVLKEAVLDVDPPARLVIIALNIARQSSGWLAPLPSRDELLGLELETRRVRLEFGLNLPQVIVAIKEIRAAGIVVHDEQVQMTGLFRRLDPLLDQPQPFLLEMAIADRVQFQALPGPDRRLRLAGQRRRVGGC
ncbi:MAG: hypothetical protein E6417_38615, partial [Bradyrhizobium sp.]|nr:hypothetical protein [Bradyrhizobium sp.]